MVKEDIIAAKIHTKKQLKHFKSQFKKHMTTAITAAFAFLIALVWRDAIQEGVNKVMVNLGITTTSYLFKIYAAIIITIICVIALILFARWGSKDSNK
jgi:uncharacterized membrane protein YozB (DUF420 family)